ncbi:vascular endothelial growth factor C [Drosophila pseudoobscura]|uniref:Vascular endothelial growth factor C n=1 Tax=Drosophila pseudoobscura pseudoobscura TaxID=46245 RepID=A0A6I8UGI5_DROPS|nr:vascular endothelial growth factor C [Drosophila pseudoobscura]
MPQTKSPTAHRLPLQLSLLLLIVSGAAGVSVASSANLQPSPRFFYAATAAATPPSDAASQTKVRLLRQTNGAAVPDDEGSCCQGAAADAGTPVTLPLELATDLSNITADYDVSGEMSSKENFKRSVTRSAIRNAQPAICSPQPTIVELKPPSDEAGNFNVYYTPACTRINRCNGCCGSTLISCQPTQTEKVQMRVRKFERGGTSKRSSEIIVVEQHLACRCDCRIKAEDCNAYQLYRRELCRCECQNTDARDKCLEQADSKYWDDANCTCACRYNQSCTTGTVFDETQCKCTDPSAPIDVVDRKRFIVQAVEVEPDNTTLYHV